MNADRPKELAADLEAFAAECEAEGLWPHTVEELKSSARDLRFLADTLSWEDGG